MMASTEAEEQVRILGWADGDRAGRCDKAFSASLDRHQLPVVEFLSVGVLSSGWSCLRQSLKVIEGPFQPQSFDSDGHFGVRPLHSKVVAVERRLQQYLCPYLESHRVIRLLRLIILSIAKCHVAPGGFAGLVELVRCLLSSSTRSWNAWTQYPWASNCCGA